MPLTVVVRTGDPGTRNGCLAEVRAGVGAGGPESVGRSLLFAFLARAGAARTKPGLLAAPVFAAPELRAGVAGRDVHLWRHANRHGKYRSQPLPTRSDRGPPGEQTCAGFC